MPPVAVLYIAGHRGCKRACARSLRRPPSGASRPVRVHLHGGTSVSRDRLERPRAMVIAALDCICLITQSDVRTFAASESDRRSTAPSGAAGRWQKEQHAG